MLQAGKEDHHYPVDQRHRHKALEELEGRGGFHLRLAHDLGHSQGEGQRGALDHVDEVVHQRRGGDTGRLRQDDPLHRLITAHADTERRFHLAFVNAEDGCADRLGHVGGEVQGQTDDGGGKGIHPHEDREQLRQSVVEQEQLNE